MYRKSIRNYLPDFDLAALPFQMFSDVFTQKTFASHPKFKQNAQLCITGYFYMVFTEIVLHGFQKLTPADFS